MNLLKTLIGIILLVSINACTTNAGDMNEKDVFKDNTPQREYYQLKTYTFDTEEQMQRTDKYLQSALIPALHRQRVGKIGVFKLHAKGHKDVDVIDLKTFMLIPLESLDKVLSIEDELANDQTYLTAGSTYINAPFDDGPYQRIETVLMRAFQDMPFMAEPDLNGPKQDRIYELRSYESATEAAYWSKVDMFNAGGEVKLFDRLGCNAVFYGEVIFGPKMPNLMYMTTYKDLETRDQKWIDFFASPEWQELLTIDKYKQTVSHADIHLMYPTDYSDY